MDYWLTPMLGGAHVAVGCERIGKTRAERLQVGKLRLTILACKDVLDCVRLGHDSIFALRSGNVRICGCACAFADDGAPGPGRLAQRSES